MALNSDKDPIIEEPIRRWMELINCDLPEKELSRKLREIYVKHNPVIAEIILESYCPNRCRHCIYPPDYHYFNKNLSSEQWVEALKKIHAEMGFKKFIFSGRSFSHEQFEIIKTLRKESSDIQMGIICNGETLRPIVDDLIGAGLDWVDISVDGLEMQHDMQRNSPGSFKRTIYIIEELKNSDAFEKINILTCLTTLNKDSILDMIELLNLKGFKNFFITPVSVLNGYRPDPGLMPTMEDFAKFIDEIPVRARNLADTWLEMDIYEAIYTSAIKELRPEIFDSFIMKDEYLEFLTERKDNEIHICYYPSSLTGTREFIVNSDGNVIPPKVMAMGNISNELTFGGIFDGKWTSKVSEELPNQQAFSFYVSEFISEKEILNTGRSEQISP